MKKPSDEFYARPALEVAPDLIGAIVRHGPTAGRIVETEAYHQHEPACHAFNGLTPTRRALFGPAGHAYVYRSYGMHAMLNVVTGEPGVGEAVLIRALEPLEGLEVMRARRGVDPARSLCSGPGKLTQALAIGLSLDGTRLGDPIELWYQGDRPAIVAGVRIGLTVALDLEWRFCEAGSRFLSATRPRSAAGVALDPLR